MQLLQNNQDILTQQALQNQSLSKSNTDLMLELQKALYNS